MFEYGSKQWAAVYGRRRRHCRRQCMLVWMIAGEENTKFVVKHIGGSAFT